MNFSIQDMLKPRYPAVHDRDNSYLLGLRGWFVIQSFLWVFMQTFVPGAVKSSKEMVVGAPSYQVDIKKSLSVLFWNDNLIYSFFILISARSICIPFLEDPSKTNIASAVFRRGLRLWFPTAVALAIVKLFFSQVGTSYIDSFRSMTGNKSISIPYDLPNALAYFNSVFNIFWITSEFTISAGNSAFPSQLLWIVNLIYMQSYTVYAVMLVTPYTRSSWRVKGAILFIVTAWWVQSWAWYSISGLMLADMVVNMDFKYKARRGIPVWKARGVYLPSWIPCTVLIAAGLLMQFLWTGWKPKEVSAELVVHAGLYYSGGLNKKYDLSQPQARDDIYLILMGLLLAVETYDWLQRILRNSVFVYLGTRSLSWFFAQGIVIYTAGIKLFLYLNTEKEWKSEACVGTVLVVCLPGVIVFGEIFYRLIDYPCRAMSYRVFDWIRD